MGDQHPFYTFLADGVSFSSKAAGQLRSLYFPLCGIAESNIKSSISPFLSGDIKLDKNRFVTKPASREDLRFDSRNFFVYIDKNVYSLTEIGAPENTDIQIGQLWHKLIKVLPQAGLQLEAVNFVPVEGSDVELMRVKVENISSKKIRFTPTFNVPLFGRALSNKHDHEHVTALLHRAEQLPQGVLIDPSMSFDERGHKESDSAYFVFGTDTFGKNPLGSFPTVDNFYGEGGNVFSPEAVTKNLIPRELSPEELNGKEITGALRFDDCELNPSEIAEFFMVIGVSASSEEAQAIYKKFRSKNDFDKALEENKKYWEEKTKSIEVKTGDPIFNAWMRWVTLQPILRRIYGCSFLPDHDYGKGGKGWRDIWQDLLSLILIEPKDIKQTLINNFAGVRIDGSNATIIGNVPGHFIADRNAITRVWMDHGVWPYLTTKLYINQTGDSDILFHENTYFRDPQLSRSFEKDLSWTPSYGNRLKDKKSNIYSGTILEHILVQHLVQFFNVGGHNCIRLESADWNDGLDMAFTRGESVAFMSQYAGNLMDLADLLERIFSAKKRKTVELAQEISVLLDTLSVHPLDYEDATAKRKLFLEQYFPSVQPEISGEKIHIPLEDLTRDLRRKAQWAFDHIRRNEKVSVTTHRWFNGYYDNKGMRVEGEHEKVVRMTLTGQVYPLMSGMADPDEIKEVIESVRTFLKDKQLGGYRLNSDFKVSHYLDLGRAFGFAYGTKENGAFFSHMAVMYAYALYKRGFVHDGYDVLQSIYIMSKNTEKSKIYPGIPEYFDSLGRGMYHYLTGSASWYVLTILTEVFGVRGDLGDLVIEPKLVKTQFGASKEAGVHFHFAGKDLNVVYRNQTLLDYGKYGIKEVYLNQTLLETVNLSGQPLVISRSLIEKIPNGSSLLVELG